MFANPWFLIALVPCASVFFLVVKRVWKKLSVLLALLPFTFFVTDRLFDQIFGYSAIPYLGLLICLVGIFMLFYNYRIDYAYTVRQFFYRLFYAFAHINFVLWLLFVIYRLVLIYL